jgi:hypothetical protein
VTAAQCDRPADQIEKAWGGFHPDGEQLAQLPPMFKGVDQSFDAEPARLAVPAKIKVFCFFSSGNKALLCFLLTPAGCRGCGSWPAVAICPNLPHKSKKTKGAAP